MSKYSGRGYSSGVSSCYTSYGSNDSVPNDPYVYANGVLRNSYGIHDELELARKEKEVLSKKMETTELVTSHKLDLELLLAIHKYIFQEIYDWAGTIRTCHIEKKEQFFKSIDYPEAPYIIVELKKRIYHLNSIRWSELSHEEMVKEYSKRIAQLWRVHPFRDGNTRAIIGFAKVYALERNIPFDSDILISKLSRRVDKSGDVIEFSIRDMFVSASTSESPDDTYLVRAFSEAMKN